MTWSGRGKGVVFALSALAILAFAGSAGATAPAQRARATQTFNYTGDWQTVEVPAGINAAAVMVLGGHGGSASACNGNNGAIVGGDGAEVRGRIGVQPGEQLRIGVGGLGGDADYSRKPGAAGWGATARGGRGGGASNHDGGAAVAPARSSAAAHRS